ncbi:MAG TPA: hypothetical protein VHL11_04665, partial [Phototrophicaceae bacterium]|nr:hypothetical protein [Phototrophicaceae bacterium]
MTAVAADSTTTAIPSVTPETTILEILIMGLGGSGKTTLMQTISQQTEWKRDQPGAWHSGKVMVDDTLIL